MAPCVPAFPKITTGFKVPGPHWATGEHSGIDYGSPGINGAEVRAPWGGTITGANWGTKGYGNHVVIDFDRLPDGSPGLWGVIAHMSRVVKTRGRVEMGELIGYVGATGNVTGPHAHLEIQPQPGWVKGSYRDPMPWHNAGGGGGDGGSSSGAITLNIHSEKLGMGEPTNGDADSKTVKELQRKLNSISLVGGTTLPITGHYGSLTDAEVRKWQEQKCGDTPDPAGRSFLGKRQRERMFPASEGYVIHDNGLPAIASRPVEPEPEPPAPGVPACPPADQFHVGVSNPAFTWMGQRFLVWLSPQEIAKEGAAYEPGPRFSTYDEENIRKCQIKMGDVADPPGSAFFGPKQWARLADAPPHGGGGGTDSGSGGGDPDPGPGGDVADAPPAPALMYPGAVWAPIKKQDGTYVGTLRPFKDGGAKIVLHTTQTKQMTPVNWANQNGRGLPHFTLDVSTNECWQHLPLDGAAWTMKAPDDGPSPNSDSGLTIQIEMVGYAEDTPRWDLAKYWRVRDLIVWLNENLYIPIKFPFPFGGQGEDVRVDWVSWRAASGIVGHGHAPWNCTTPDTPILCGDLQWRRAGDLKPGDEIIGFDEEPVAHYTDSRGVERRTRRYRHGHVVHNIPFIGQARRVVTPRGEVVCTPDHPWLVWGLANPAKQHEGFVWKQTHELEPGDLLAFMDEPWETPDNRQVGWLAGMLDADGYFTYNTGGQNTLMGLAQRESEATCITDAQDILKQYGIDSVTSTSNTSGVLRKDGQRTTMVEVRVVGGVRAQARAMGVLQPPRFQRMGRHRVLDDRHVKRGVTVDLVPVTVVEELPDQPMAGIETTIHTYITNGFLTHQTHWDPGAINVDQLRPQLPEPPEPPGSLPDWLREFIQSNWAPIVIIGTLVLLVLAVLFAT